MERSKRDCRELLAKSRRTEGWAGGALIGNTLYLFIFYNTARSPVLPHDYRDKGLETSRIKTCGFSHR